MKVTVFFFCLSLIAIGAEKILHRHPHFPGIDDIYGFYAILALATVFGSLILSKILAFIQVEEEFYHDGTC